MRGVRDRAIMLELRRKNGNVLAIGYGWLERAEFDPSEGITLHLVGQKIRIKGRNLNDEARPFQPVLCRFANPARSFLSCVRALAISPALPPVTQLCPHAGHLRFLRVVRAFLEDAPEDLGRTFANHSQYWSRRVSNSSYVGGFS